MSERENSEIEKSIHHIAAEKELLRKKMERLSPREMEILSYIAKGLKHKEIAALSSRDPETVRGQMKDVHNKLGTNKAAQAILMFLEYTKNKQYE